MAISIGEMSSHIRSVAYGFAKEIKGADGIKKGQRSYFKNDLELISAIETKVGRLELPGGKDLEDFMTKVYGYINSKQQQSQEEEEKEPLTEEQFWEEHVCDYLSYESATKIKLVKVASFDYLSSASVGKTLDIPSVKAFVKKLYIHLDDQYELPYDMQTMLGDVERALPFYSMKRRTALFDRLKFSGNEDDSNLRRVLEDLKVEELEASLKVMKHLMWAVKRRAIGLPIFNEVFPVFVGKPGVAKSVTADRLGSPLGEFYKSMDLSDIKEDRDNAITSNIMNLMLFDEMAGADKSDINKLKRWITASEQGVRHMATNSRSFYDKNAQGFGTSNSKLRTILKDPSGNRRFFEIQLLRNKNDAPEWVNEDLHPDMALGADFWVEIWKNIDEDKPNGYWNPQVDTDVIEIMDGCVLPSSVKLWAEQYRDKINILQSKGEDIESCLVWKKLDLLWENFDQFEKNERIYFHITRETFSRECKEALSDIHPSMRAESRVVNGTKQYGFYVIDADYAKAKETAPKFAPRTAVKGE